MADTARIFLTVEQALSALPDGERDPRGTGEGRMSGIPDDLRRLLVEHARAWSVESGDIADPRKACRADLRANKASAALAAWTKRHLKEKS